MDDEVRERDPLKRFLPPPAEAEEEGLPSLKPGEYRAHGRPANKPIHSVHFVTPAGTVRSFQYVHLDSGSQYTAERITLQFMGLEPVRVTIEGRNLWRLYDYLHQHRVPWVLVAARDFAAEGQLIVTRIDFCSLVESSVTGGISERAATPIPIKREHFL